MMKMESLSIDDLNSLKKKIIFEIRARYKSEADTDPNVYAIRRSWFYGGSHRDPSEGIRHSHYTADIGWGSWMANDLTHSGLLFFTKREAENIVEVFRQPQPQSRCNTDKFTYSVVPLLKDHPSVVNAKPELYKNT